MDSTHWKNNSHPSTKWAQQSTILRHIFKSDSWTIKQVPMLYRRLIIPRWSEKPYIIEIYKVKQWVLCYRFLHLYYCCHLSIPTCLFHINVVDLVWVTCLLQNASDCCRRSCKVTKKLLLHVDLGSHGDHLVKFFSCHKCCYNGQWLLTSHYFNCCFDVVALHSISPKMILV